MSSLDDASINVGIAVKYIQGVTIYYKLKNSNSGEWEVVAPYLNERDLYRLSNSEITYRSEPPYAYNVLCQDPNTKACFVTSNRYPSKESFEYHCPKLKFIQLIQETKIEV